MIDVPNYELQLRLNGRLIGDVREIAQSLTWKRCRTSSGVDSIEFTVNDVLFANWCEERGVTITEMLRPLALDCRVVRNGVELLGGFLATVPGYQPNGTSASLTLGFDGYENLLAGVYIHPTPAQSLPMQTMISNYIKMTDERAAAAGKAYGFTEGQLSEMPTVTQTFDDYKTVKDFITDRCDNTSGAGKFEVYWHADRTYDILLDAEFGNVINDYIIYYPTMLVGVTAASLSAQEVDGFASTVIAIGSGETSGDSDTSTVISSIQTNSQAVLDYGYYETLLQDSSVSVQATLDENAQTELASVCSPLWQPEITLSGAQVAPIPEGNNGLKIWVGDTVQLSNSEDRTGMTSGTFRVNELSVSVSASNAETITPTLERIIETEEENADTNV